jgi:hypothetical protein
MVRSLSVVCTVPVLLACSSPQDMGESIGLDAGESAEETLARRLAPGSEPGAFTDEEKRGEAARDFAYNWPRQVSAIAPLAAMLQSARDQELARQKAEWEESVAEFAQPDDTYECFSCVNRSYVKSWVVAADTPRLLVIGAETYTYSGGAHGNTNYDALVWDRRANGGKGAAMNPVALFASPAAFEAAVRADFCAALLVARSERLEMNVAGIDPLEECPGIAELVVVPTSSDGRMFDTIQFLAAPYVAGSYAEGPYTINVPVTEAVLAAVKPDYRAEFASGL